MTKKRNTNAICDTCPYFYTRIDSRLSGECRIRSDALAGKSDNPASYRQYDSWCGEHPDFFLDDEPAE